MIVIAVYIVKRISNIPMYTTCTLLIEIQAYFRLNTGKEIVVAQDPPNTGMFTVFGLGCGDGAVFPRGRLRRSDSKGSKGGESRLHI